MIDYGEDTMDSDDVASVRDWIWRRFTDKVIRDAVVGIYDCRIARGETPMQAAECALRAHLDASTKREETA